MSDELIRAIDSLDFACDVAFHTSNPVVHLSYITSKILLDYLRGDKDYGNKTEAS